MYFRIVIIITQALFSSCWLATQKLFCQLGQIIMTMLPIQFLFDVSYFVQRQRT